jgi:THO complex subunit 7
MALNLDNKTLTQRLLTKEGQSLGVSARGSLSKCALKLAEFKKSIEEAMKYPDKETSTKVQKIGNDLIREIQLHDLEMKKMALGAEAAKAEMNYYETIGEETQTSITKVKGDIEKLKTKLEHEMKVRKNRLEYEALAKMASDRESSKITKRKLAKEREDITNIGEESRKIQKRLDVKGRQFHLLMQSLSDLKRGTDEDSLRESIVKSAENSDS